MKHKIEYIKGNSNGIAAMVFVVERLCEMIQSVVVLFGVTRVESYGAAWWGLFLLWWWRWRWRCELRSAPLAARATPAVGFQRLHTHTVTATPTQLRNTVGRQKKKKRLKFHATHKGSAGTPLLALIYPAKLKVGAHRPARAGPEC